MRPARFQEFAVDALATGPDVQSVEPWSEGTKRPYGVRVTFSSGAQILAAITAQSPDGEDYSQPETPVLGEPPAEVPVPDLYAGGKLSPQRAELYLAALLTNAGSPEIVRAYGYSDRPVPSQHPGLGVQFHSGGRIFMPFVHTVRAGQDRTTTREYQLQEV